MSAATSSEVWNDHPYLTLENATIDENAPTGTRITRVLAVDPEGDAVTISLIHDAGGRFKVQDGYLVVADGARLDYETSSWHDILIRAEDATGMYYDSIVRIYLNNVVSEPPTPVPPPLPDNHAPTIVRLNGDRSPKTAQQAPS